MKTKFLAMFLVALLLFSCASCARMAAGKPTPTASVEQTKAPSPRPTSTPRPTPIPTPATETVTSKQITLSFFFGERTGVYTGETLNGLPHGTGSFTTQNDDGLSWVYQGAWENGHFDGRGNTTWADGFKETGTYANDELNGLGSEYQDNALLYEGLFRDGIHNGQGRLYDIAGKVIYDGIFTSGYLDETSEARALRLTPFMEQCQTIDFGDYEDDPAAYEGSDIVLEGEIYDVGLAVEGEEYFCDIWVFEKGKSSRIMSITYVYSIGEPLFQNGDTIEIWGTFSGTYTYTFDDGTQETMPTVQAWNIQLKDS